MDTKGLETVVLQARYVDGLYVLTHPLLLSNCEVTGSSRNVGFTLVSESALASNQPEHLEEAEGL